VCSRIFDTRKSYLPNVRIPLPTHDPCLGRQIGSVWKAPWIFFSVSYCTIHSCTSWSYAVKYRAIISIRGITDVSSFHTVSTSRKWLDLRWLVGWQLAPKKHRKTSRLIITVAPVAIQSLPASFWFGAST